MLSEEISYKKTGFLFTPLVLFVTIKQFYYQLGRTRGKQIHRYLSFKQPMTGNYFRTIAFG